MEEGKQTCEESGAGVPEPRGEREDGPRQSQQHEKIGQLGRPRSEARSAADAIRRERPSRQVVTLPDRQTRQSKHNGDGRQVSVKVARTEDEGETEQRETDCQQRNGGGPAQREQETHQSGKEE